MTTDQTLSNERNLNMTNTYELVWEDPPPAVQDPGNWIGRLAPLKEHPGKWARIIGPTKTAQSSVGSSISRGAYRGIEPGEFEAVTRKTQEGHYVYVRYMGNENTPPKEGTE